MTLREWIPQWLEYYKLGTIKERSYHQLELLVKHFPDSLLDMHLDDVKPMHLQGFGNQFSQGASKSYMDKMRVLIHALFTDAVENGFCIKDPSTRLKIPQIIEKPRESFTAEEVKRIVNFALDYPHRRIAVAVLVLLFTGIRRGELLGLKWDDLTDNTLTIRRGVYQENGTACVEDYIAKTPKSLRTVPLMPEIAHHIATLPRAASLCSGHPAVSCGIPGTSREIMVASSMRCKTSTPMCAACRSTAAAIPLPPLPLHPALICE